MCQMMKCIATLESSCSKYKIKRSRGDELQKWRQNTRSVVVGVFFGLGQVHFGDLRVVPEHLSTLPDTAQLRTSKQGQCTPGSPGRAGDSDLWRPSLHLNTIPVRFRSKLEFQGRCLKMMRSAYASPDVRAVALACEYCGFSM